MFVFAVLPGNTTGIKLQQFYTINLKSLHLLMEFQLFKRYIRVVPRILESLLYIRRDSFVLP